VDTTYDLVYKRMAAKTKNLIFRYPYAEKKTEKTVGEEDKRRE
jgi:hypothetical protein